MNYVYILRCKDETLYTGYTNNLQKRIQAHSNKKGAKYTMGRLPVQLVYYEKYNSKKEAMCREYAIKKMSRENKLNLIKKMSL
ncbi:GIY-YIG nuclease family protein [Clostridium sp. WILCCON 0269]|uniref:GIY-YIG nuclease family protein n=1 Tax=Candidatus Clostridium eludens TaxID=3381663 RepID=A0ABW8SHX0_9CLOT